MNNNNNISDMMHKYGLALEMLETELRIVIQNYEYKNQRHPVDHIKSRLKSMDSIEKKLAKKNCELNEKNIVEHVHDLIGIRIVCSFVPDVYEIVDLIKANKNYIIKEEKDYIKNPKDTGYISYHLNILVPTYLDCKKSYVEAEIQVRTMAMDFWASLDHKISYKFDTIPDELREEMYKCSEDIKMLDEKMNRLNEIADKYK